MREYDTKTISTTWRSAVAACVCLLVPSQLVASTPFITSADGHDILLPNSDIQLSGGDIRVNGQPRFLIGTILLEGVDQDTGIPTTGYPDSLAWLYESLPDYTSAQKLGLDSFGITPEHTWRKIFRPRAIPRRDMNALRRPLNSGLPIIAELAIEKGSHAWMAYMEGVNPKEFAWFDGYSSGIPYSVVTEDGLSLWNTIWRSSAEYFRQQKAQPFAYRIFANADYFDTSTRAKADFTKELSTRYKTVELLNSALKAKYSSAYQAGRFNNSTDNPRIHVDYTKFLENAFTVACSNAVTSIASASGNTEPIVFFQPQTLRCQGIDLYKAAQQQRILCAPAHQENPILTALYMKAVAEGKPVISCDIPVQGSADNVRNTLLTQFARGYSMSFVSTWKREARAWIRYKREVPPDGGRPKTVLDTLATEAAGQSHAKAHPDYFMNPYAVSANALGGIRQAKKDIFATGDLFSSSNRTANTHVALLYSRTCDRLAATKHAMVSTNTVSACADALIASGIKTALVLEEQLGKIKLNTYQVLVASDSSFAVTDDTPTILQKFVEAGGTLILTEKAVTKNEYGDEDSGGTFSTRSDTNAWSSVEHAGFKSSRRNIGTGRVIRLARTPTPQDLRKSLDTVITEAGVRKTWQCLDRATGHLIEGIEVTHAMKPDGTHGLILFNRTDVERDVLIKIDGLEKPKALDLCRQKALPDVDGGFTLRLTPGCGEIVQVVEAHVKTPEQAMRQIDRMGVPGFRPVPLPHHRTCGFPLATSDWNRAATGVELWFVL